MLKWGCSHLRDELYIEAVKIHCQEGDRPPRVGNIISIASRLRQRERERSQSGQWKAALAPLPEEKKRTGSGSAGAAFAAVVPQVPTTKADSAEKRMSLAYLGWWRGKEKDPENPYWPDSEEEAADLKIKIDEWCEEHPITR